ncbi:methylaspartate mutase subunit E [Terasakiella sp. A23]|uniref:methylaspartate mutase subunit E n=1 Tax=Terasakiella sp. FCG-A23 TaxID=3080561 RepID=UPI002955D520|nr:methylaspartate mutase subunit E [Terasakiella sp. A23]MDV7339481.1 methylaspartate mutase subunit E [Terasakiella sp. A23]
MIDSINVSNKQLSDAEFEAEREKVLQTWHTGKDVDFQKGVKLQQDLPKEKQFSSALADAHAQGRTLLQPRAGVALLREHTKLLQDLTPYCDVLPTTVDAYTRHNRYEEAQKGIDKSRAAGTSLLNGFPPVNHGVEACSNLVASLEKPVQVRHGTPDARLLGEITLASGFSSYEGGGISYNIPYAKRIPLEQSIRHWQYCDRLVGLYEREGVRINREPFGPLTGTLVPPFISHVVAILEGLLALEQGARCITLGYGQSGNVAQDIAAIRSLRKLANHYFMDAGFDDYALTTVFHQWMGGFPEDEDQATAVISLGAMTAKYAGATKIIVKTPHEAAGIPTMEANRAGLQMTHQMIGMIANQNRIETMDITQEMEVIEAEVRAIMRRVIKFGEGDIAKGAILAFKKGIIDIPFAPAVENAGKLTPIRDNFGAIRVLETGHVPLPPDVRDFNREKIDERALAEGRSASFDMVVDDVRAISSGKLIGRPDGYRETTKKRLAEYNKL